MNNEIKTILDYLKDDKWDYYPSDGIPYKVFLMEERDKLLDYITNLQEENQRLKEEYDLMYNKLVSESTLWESKYYEADNDRHELFEKKEKAIEYINKNILISFDKVGFKTDKVAGIVVDKLLEILNGGDE